MEDKHINPLFGIWCQKILPLVYDESLSYYEVLCKIQQKLNEVIESQNNLQNEFYQLKDWIDTQLENYAKDQLQEWLDDGTLENMILSLGQIVKYFDTTEEMLQSQNLQVGQVIKTLGYNNKEDCGGGLFQIDNAINNKFYQFKITENLYANLLNTVIYPEMIGCKCDGVTDDTVLFQKLITFVQNNKYTYSIKLMNKIAVTNILINDWIKINFNNVNIVMIGDNGIGVHINTNYNYGETVPQNIQKGFGNELFESISIDGNQRAGYDYLLVIESRDTYFNSIHLWNCYSNGVHIDTYDGVRINDLQIRGLNTNNNMDIVGLTIDREDCFYDNVEIAYFQTLIKNNTHLASQFGKVHLWNDNTYTQKSIGIYCPNGLGNNYNSLLFDTLKYGFYGELDNSDVGYPVRIDYLKMYYSQSGGYVFANMQYGFGFNVSIGLLDSDVNIFDHPFFGSIEQTNQKTLSERTIGISFKKFLTNQILCGRSGNKLYTPYNQQTINITENTSSLNCGMSSYPILNQLIMKSQICGYALLYNQALTELIAIGVVYFEYPDGELIINFTQTVNSGNYVMRLSLNATIGTWE